MARILVIEDEDNIRNMVRLALEHADHMVGTACGGLEGVRLFGDGTDWDVVLLDQRLPDMMGLEVIGRLCARDPDAWVIMMTAVGTMELASEAQWAGARDFLRKPFTTETLRGAVDAALQGKRPLQESRRSRQPVYSSQTLNGFRIEFRAAAATGRSGANVVHDLLDRMLHRPEADVHYGFVVTSPTGEARDCTVFIVAELVREIRASAVRDAAPDARFWQALSEQVLADYLWQHAAFPPDQMLRVEGLTPHLRRWVEAALPKREYKESR